MSNLLESHYGSSAQDIGEIIIENPAVMNINKTAIAVDEQQVRRGPEKQIGTSDRVRNVCYFKTVIQSANEKMAKSALLQPSLAA